MNWTTLTAALQNYLQQAPVGGTPGSGWSAAIPVMVNNAELRIYRDLDFLATRGENTSLSVVTGQRTLSLGGITGETVGGYPVAYAYPVVVQRVALLVGGTWINCMPVSLDMLEMIWPTEATTGIPTEYLAYVTLIDHATLAFAPTPAAAYNARVVGTWRPAPMSDSQQQSWLGDNVPDLLFAAAMFEAEAYIQNFGAQSDNPQAAQSWQAEYDRLKNNAMEEEQRRKGQDPGWQPYSPTPLAGTPRN